MKKILIFTNSDQHFYAHLLPIAKAAQKTGYHITLLTSIKNHRDLIESHNIKVISIDMDRKSINPFTALMTIFKVITIVRRLNPDIIHNFTIKPILYGSLASYFAQKKLKVINNFLGMGYIFINNGYLSLTLRMIICSILSIYSKTKGAIFIVQNSDDKNLLILYNIAPENDIKIQCSVGIDIDRFPELPEPEKPIVFALVARMLEDKGIYEFVEAARILKQKNVLAEFWLVGSPDEHNKSSITLLSLNSFNKEGYVKYLGFQDVSLIWQKAHVAVLPSYREGLSRSLLEAGAYGKAIITTDAPGGRELINDKINGLLVRPRSAEELAKAMELLVSNHKLRQELGRKIREHIINHYDSRIIEDKIIEFYDTNE